MRALAAAPDPDARVREQDRPRRCRRARASWARSPQADSGGRRDVTSANRRGNTCGRRRGTCRRLLHVARSSSCWRITTTRSSLRTSTTRRAMSPRRLRDALAAQTRQALVHPVFCGSAITGAGVDLAPAPRSPSCCPQPAGDADGPVAGSVFKIERGRAATGSPTSACSPAPSGRETGCPFGGDHEAKVTAISVFEHGTAVAATVRRGGADREALGPRRRSSSAT